MARPSASSYDDLAQDYDSGYRGLLWEIYDQVTWEAATHGLRANARVLDAGAGTGKWARAFLRAGHRVTLLDPSREMLRQAHVNLGRAPADAPERIVAGIESIPLPDDSFDLVFCEGDPLSYTREARLRAARELVRVLAPGGRLYVSCDNRWLAALALLGQGNVEEGLDAAENGCARDPYGIPLHAFGAAELENLLVVAGLADVQVRGKLGLLHMLPHRAQQAIAAKPSGVERLLAIERKLSSDPGFAGLASHLHATGEKR